MAKERGLVNVEITERGMGVYQDGQTRGTDEVKITTRRGQSVWVDEKDVYARQPNPETETNQGD